LSSRTILRKGRQQFFDADNPDGAFVPADRVHRFQWSGQFPLSCWGLKRLFVIVSDWEFHPLCIQFYRVFFPRNRRRLKYRLDPFFASPCLVLPRLALPGRARPCLARPRPASPCRALSCLTWPRLATPRLAAPRLFYHCSTNRPASWQSVTMSPKSAVMMASQSVQVSSSVSVGPSSTPAII